MSHSPTLEEVRKWPATCEVTKAAQALGISRAKLYAQIKSGDEPVKVLRFGRSVRVITADLVRLLEAA
ncbi:helix-turn-helix domain-containing protein [Streptomyces omiyaensis]|uniref:Helix-turn-helix domain-containing protein n=1 Tax=Streptomyces omiyaensis TaxID=68247 RepID=A0ABW7BNZ7_9ACTN